MCSVFVVENFLNEQTRVSIPSLSDMATEFPRIAPSSLHELDAEWRSIDNEPIPVGMKQIRNT